MFSYLIDGNKLEFEWRNVVDGFNMPLKVTINGKEMWLKPTDHTQTITYGEQITRVVPDRNFYIEEDGKVTRGPTDE
jgi:hypothetical protein